MGSSHNYIIVADRERTQALADVPESLRAMMDRYPQDRFFVIFHAAGDEQCPSVRGRDAEKLLSCLNRICWRLRQRGAQWDFYFLCSPELVASVDQIMISHDGVKLPDMAPPREGLH